MLSNGGMDLVSQKQEVGALWCIEPVPCLAVAVAAQHVPRVVAQAAASADASCTGALELLSIVLSFQVKLASVSTLLQMA